jgi:hypothetical protein
MSKRCVARNRRGTRSGAWAVTGKVKCALHLDPRRAAQMGAKHGNRALLPVRADAAAIDPPRTAGDVLAVLANTMAQVHSRSMDVRIANSLAYLSASLLRAIEVADLEKRLAALERKFNSAIGIPET